ncbi:unnamed protein product [Onchocerca flexuosa]|uniref:Protein quiver n=1 Tax=Onchocerca flexuosa TaxID=387005 RepID=A0A183HWN6_9BILA|nr:unnamed protein product [Onchocerca flexuosa]
MLSTDNGCSNCPCFNASHQQQKQFSSLSSNSKLGSPVNITTIFLLLQIICTCSALTCMTCATSSSVYQNTIQLDQFRIIVQLPSQTCSMEPIRCNRDQDVCVTITMNIGGGSLYWIGAGCDRQEYFQHTACENVRILTRNVQLGTVQERRVLQRVCVCTFDRCNIATTANLFRIDKLSYVNILICLLVTLYIYNILEQH